MSRLISFCILLHFCSVQLPSRKYIFNISADEQTDNFAITRCKLTERNPISRILQLLNSLLIENNPIYFLVCVASHLCWLEEACLIVCVQYVITLSSGSETSLIICLHKFQTNWQRSRHTRAPDGHVCASQPPTTGSISCMDEYIRWQWKSRTKGGQAY